MYVNLSCITVFIVHSLSVDRKCTLKPLVVFNHAASSRPQAGGGTLKSAASCVLDIYVADSDAEYSCKYLSECIDALTLGFLLQLAWTGTMPYFSFFF